MSLQFCRRFNLNLVNMRLSCVILLVLSSIYVCYSYHNDIIMSVNRRKSLHTAFISDKQHRVSGHALQGLKSNFQESILVHGLLGTTLAVSTQNSLTSVGLLHATALGTGLWTFLGFKGWFLCVLYFLLGSWATKLKFAEKERNGIAESRSGARGPENVWGSAAAAMVCASLSAVFPQHTSVVRLGYVAAIATKLSDTFASELGKAFGKHTYLITSLHSVPRGTEGAVSLEGTLAGVLGSLLIAVPASALGVLPAGPHYVAVCAISALVATTIESYIGAVYQNDQHPWLSNEWVNCIMTVIGASLAMACAVGSQ